MIKILTYRGNLSQIFEKFKITVFGAVVKFQGLKFEFKSLLYLIQRWFSFRGELFYIPKTALLLKIIFASKFWCVHPLTDTSLTWHLP